MADKAAVRARFEAVFPSLVKELTDYVREQNFPEAAVKWFADNLDYNTPGGKLNRGLSVVDTYAIITGRKSALDLPDDEYKLAAILGWSIELLQAYFLVADDMMDQSVTRRGQPCWYRKPHVGNIAINDAFMLEAAIYFLLKKHFRQHPAYVDLLELFHEVTFQTELGQLIDLLTAPEDHVDLDKFTLHKHHLIVVYKTAFYSFYLPVALAAQLAGVKDDVQYKAALDILLPLGEYFQVQDDYLDAYAPPEVLGKIGTDIQDNKCSWVINTALAHATPEQRQVLDQNYGRKDDTAEARVKEVFNAPNVDVKAKFEAYEQASYEKITGLIGQFPHDQAAKDAGRPILQPEVFTAFLSKVYKRSK